MKSSIIVLDDDKKIADLISIYLKNANFNVTTFYDSMEAEVYLSKNIPDCLILDIMMPKIDGLTMLSEIREKYTYPILLVSAKDEKQDIISGLIDGADEYITKPFDPNELVARVNSLLRRTKVYDSKLNDLIRYKDLEIDVVKRVVKLKNKKISFTPSEFTILKELFLSKGDILSNEVLFQKITGDNYYSRDCNSIAVHIRNIRIKLNDSFESPLYIKTSWGVGYYVE